MLHVTRTPIGERNNEAILANVVARLESVGFEDIGYDVLKPTGTVVWWADRRWTSAKGVVREQRFTSIQWAHDDKTELLSFEQFCDTIVGDLAQRLRDIAHE
jgi:hypothetical protein